MPDWKTIEILQEHNERLTNIEELLNLLLKQRDEKEKKKNNLIDPIKNKTTEGIIRDE